MAIFPSDLSSIRDLFMPVIEHEASSHPGLQLDIWLDRDHDMSFLEAKYGDYLVVRPFLNRKDTEMGAGHIVRIAQERLGATIREVMIPLRISQEAFVQEYDEILQGQEIMDDLNKATIEEDHY